MSSLDLPAQAFVGLHVKVELPKRSMGYSPLEGLVLWIGKGSKWTKDRSAEELNPGVSPLTLLNVRTSYPDQSSSQIGRHFHSRSLMSSTECSWCLSVLEDQVTPCCFSCSVIQP